MSGASRALFRRTARSDAAGSLVPGNYDTDMVRASPLASSGDFLLRPAVC